MEQLQTVRRHRLQMMTTGALAIFFTGFPHVWSVYQPYMTEQTGWSQGQASMCFYLALASFVFGNIIGGRMQDTKSPRKVLWIGGGIFSAGILLSAFLILPSPLPFYVTYGIMQGFGQGMVYTTIISTAQKWFADRPGFGSGIIVTANGLCGFFLAPASRALLGFRGPKITFLLLGSMILISCILSSVCFFVPETKTDVLKTTQGLSEQKQYTSKEMMRTKKFYFLLGTMLFGLLSYFLVSPVSQSHQLSLGIPEAVAVSAVMLGSIMNAGMRLLLPTMADRIGRIPCIRAVLVLAVAAMTVLGFAQSYAATIAIVLMYGCYGGIMGSFPSLTSSVFGMRHTGENYGYVMLGIVIATFAAPGLTGFLTKRGYGMQTVFLAGAVFAVLAWICLCFLEKELKKQSALSITQNGAPASSGN